MAKNRLKHLGVWLLAIAACVAIDVVAFVALWQLFAWIHR